MKISLLIVMVAFSTAHSLQAQHQTIEDEFIDREALSHFRYLASDELKGRDAAKPEIDIAAKYIAEQFWKYGTQELPGAEGYFQPVPFRVSAPPRSGIIQLGDSLLIHGKNMMVLDGESLNGAYEMVVAGYGLEEDFNEKDIAGKLVVTRVGLPGRTKPSELLAASRQKLALAQKRGALGLMEMYHLPTTPWLMVSYILGKTQMVLSENEMDQETVTPLAHMWVKDLSGEFIKAIDKKHLPHAVVQIQGKKIKSLQGKNVVAVIEGTSPQLKNEYVMLSAHYDHLGVGAPNAEGDSIYNGARDNAVGTVAILNAARYFSKYPPKRSILLCAWTAEEKGLLGSAYFSENPLIPLKQVVFNLNIDNGGYNNTGIITVIGLGRTSADHLIEEAVADFGLDAVADPSPGQGLYDRSDNVNFAKKGIPAPTFSLGFTAFDEEIMKYYHQAGDQVDNFDLDYALKYWKAYLLAAEKIANWNQRPAWLEGDKYEDAGKQLYGK